MPIAAPDRTYVYAATVRRVMDGDTLELDVDLGFHVIARQSIRMEGGDAAELRSKVPEERTKAQAAMARLAALLPPGSS